MRINCNLEGAVLRTGKSTLPSGTYNLQITGCDVVQTAGGNSAIKMEYAVEDGDLKGRPWSEYFNVNHSKENVVKFAKDDLFTTLTHAKHKNPKMLTDSSEAIGLKLRMVIEEEPQEWTRDDGEIVQTTNNRVIMRLPYDEKVTSVTEKEEKPTTEKQAEAIAGNVDSDVPWQM